MAIFETMTMECTVEYAVQAPDAAGGAPPPLLLALHGWGQCCGGFIENFDALRARGILVVAPQAPHPFYVDSAAKRVGFSWLTKHRRGEAVADLVRYLDAVLVRAGEAHPFDAAQVYVLGFSQGASMAYRHATWSARPVAGVIACSADLPPDVAARLETAPPARVLLIHGEKDRVAPLAVMDEAYEVLSAAAVPVARHIHRGGHRMTAGAVGAAADWIVAGENL